jgi:hypothetical protein
MAHSEDAQFKRNISSRQVAEPASCNELRVSIISAPCKDAAP